MMPAAEKADALALSGGSLGMLAGVSEPGHVTGIYHAICRGYKAEHEAEYLENFPQLLAMRAKRDKLVRFVPKIARGLWTKFLSELDAFEAYMESMTEVKWDQYAPNVVTDVGANALLDAGLAGSSYTVTGPYMGLIGAVSYTGIPVVGDTMASHASSSHVWTEAGVTNAPTYSGGRKTVSWSAASSRSKSPSSAPVFTFTGSGTAKGVFLVYGSGAVSTVDSTAGTLYSAGLFTGGDQAVVSTNTVTVTYSTSL